MKQRIIYKIKKNPYLFFLTKFIILLIIVLILDFSIGNILNYFYFKQKSGFQFRTTYSIEKTNAEFLIFGSSKAMYDYRCDILEDRLKMSCYNTGRGGNFIFYNYAILKSVLKRYNPKIVVLDFFTDEFKKKNDSYDKLSSLLPYYNSHPEIHSIIEMKSFYEKFKLISKIYPYNSLLFSIAIGNLEMNKKRKTDINGYVPLTKVWNNPIRIDTASLKDDLDYKKIEFYENFIKDCKEHGIQLYLFVSPYFVKSNHQYYSVAIGSQIAKKYNIKFYDYSRDTLFTSNHSLFADEGHLNEKGGRIFTNLVVDRIMNNK